MRGEEQAGMVGLQVILERELCLYLEALGCATVWRMPSVLEAEKKEKKKRNLAYSIAVHQAANAPIV